MHCAGREAYSAALPRGSAQQAVSPTVASSLQQVAPMEVTISPSEAVLGARAPVVTLSSAAPDRSLSERNAAARGSSSVQQRQPPHPTTAATPSEAAATPAAAREDSVVGHENTPKATAAAEAPKAMTAAAARRSTEKQRISPGLPTLAGLPGQPPYSKARLTATPSHVITSTQSLDRPQGTVANESKAPQRAAASPQRAAASPQRTAASPQQTAASSQRTVASFQHVVASLQFQLPLSSPITATANTTALTVEAETAPRKQRPSDAQQKRKERVSIPTPLPVLSGASSDTVRHSRKSGPSVMSSKRTAQSTQLPAAPPVAKRRAATAAAAGDVIHSGSTDSELPESVTASPKRISAPAAGTAGAAAPAGSADGILIAGQRPVSDSVRISGPDPQVIAQLASLPSAAAQQPVSDLGRNTGPDPQAIAQLASLRSAAATSAAFPDMRTDRLLPGGVLQNATLSGKVRTAGTSWEM